MTRIALATAAALIALAAALPAQADFTLYRPNGISLNGQTWNGSAVSSGIVSPTLVGIDLPRR